MTPDYQPVFSWQVNPMREIDYRLTVALGNEIRTASSMTDGYPIGLLHYSTDREICAAAEADIVARGLGERYAEALIRLLFGGDVTVFNSAIEISSYTTTPPQHLDTFVCDGNAYVLAITMAPPDVRCRAMLAVLEDTL
jgi:hypothetical protein